MVTIGFIGPRAEARIHHNIFARYVTWDKNKNGGISIVYDVPGIQIYNNTFDGGGKEKSFDVPVIEVPGSMEKVGRRDPARLAGPQTRQPAQ